MTRFRAMQLGAMVAGASVMLAIVAVLAMTQGQTQAPFATASATLPQVATPAPPTPSTLSSDTNLRMTNDVRVYQLIKDAVVNITSSRLITAQVSTGNEVFDRFAPQYRQVPAQSLGSGFVIHPSGYIITNEHVVEEGTDVQCVFFDGQKLPAQVIATDNEHDLAVLKVQPKAPLHAIALGSSEDLMIGEPVYAIGNPYGYAGTMTRGIVSAVDRTLEISPDKSYTGLIQTDASINPGNSGGPLLNAYGQVVGINTAIRQGATGIGFAIAVSNMRDLLPAFLNPEALNRAQVGFTVEEKRENHPPSSVNAQVLVKNVTPGSSAQKAGLERNDQIVAVGGASVTNVVDALVDLGSAKPGQSLALEVLRGSDGKPAQRLELKVPVTQAPPPPVEDLLLSKMGIKGQTVTPALVSAHKLAVNRGVYVETVTPGSAGARCGLKEGDVLIQLGRYYVSSVEDVATLLKTVTSPVDAMVGIVRDNSIARGPISLK
jgi:serine protease Do